MIIGPGIKNDLLKNWSVQRCSFVIIPVLVPVQSMSILIIT